VEQPTRSVLATRAAAANNETICLNIPRAYHTAEAARNRLVGARAA
jgi:hypothetical protein